MRVNFPIERNISNCIYMYTIDYKIHENRFKELTFDNND